MTDSFLLYIAVGILFAGFLGASRMRLLSLLFFFRIQAILLAAYAYIIASSTHEMGLYFSAGLVLLVKGIAIPEFFKYVAVEKGVSSRLRSYIRPSFIFLLSALLVAVSIWIAYDIAITPIPVIASAFSLVMIGMLGLMTRTDLFGQSIAFLTMENGIFILGLSLVHGLPFFVEMGVLLDVLIGVVIMVALMKRAHQEYQTFDTEKLQELTD